MNTYEQRLFRPAPRSLIEKSFKDMTKNEFKSLKRLAINYFKKSELENPTFSGREILCDYRIFDFTTPKRIKTDIENHYVNYFKSNKEIAKQIKLKLEYEKEARIDNDSNLPVWQKELDWRKLK